MQQVLPDIWNVCAVPTVSYPRRLIFTKTAFLAMKQWLIDMWVKVGW
jgi:hypothetical protein